VANLKSVWRGIVAWMRDGSYLIELSRYRPFKRVCKERALYFYHEQHTEMGEVVLCALSLSRGVGLLMPGDAFAPAGYHALAFLPDTAWGAVFATTGTLRSFALFFGHRQARTVMGLAAAFAWSTTGLFILFTAPALANVWMGNLLVAAMNYHFAARGR
jgi:hypothetical protein